MVATVTLRSVKGSALTHAEVDANFSSLKAELDTKGNANGLAPLDTSSKVPSSNLPSTDSISEGTSNLYFTAARAVASVLTGLNVTATGTVVATDTVLVGVGKLQKQFTDYAALAVTFTNKVLTAPVVNGLTGDTSAWNIGSNQLVKDTAGNLGLGVTPSAWSGFKAIDISTGAAIASTGGTADVVQNAYHNGTNWIYKTTGPASLIRQQGGLVYCFNAPSGTAGATVPFVAATTLDASGNLGIGITPSAWISNRRVIEIAGNTASTLALNSGISEIWHNGYYNASSVPTYSTTAPAGLVTFNNHTPGGWTWFSAPSGTAGTGATITQKMSLDANGVLIVNGAASSVYVSPSTPTNNALYRAVNTGGTFYMGLDNSAAGLTSAYAGNIFHSGNYPINFSTNSTLRMTLDGTGNLGVGVTPKAWNSDYKSIDVGVNTSFYGRVNSLSSTGVSANCYRASDGNWKYISTATASRVEIDSGNFYFIQAPSGTAGNNISFTFPFTITAAGNVEHTNYTKLGTGYTSANDYHPAIKTKVLKGTVHTNSVNFSNIGSHGVTTSKIISIRALVTDSGGGRIPPNSGVTNLAGFQYDVNESAGNLYVVTNNTAGANGNSSAIFGRAIVFEITYEE